MLQCHDGEGIYKTFISNDDCDENHVNVFNFALADVGYEVVCDADPCHIAVFEVFDDGSDSSDSGDWESSNSTFNGTFEFETTLSAARRLQVSSDHSGSSEHSDSPSESSSSDSSSCDYSGTPDIAAFIVGACQAMDGTESMLITCTGTHDATVGLFMDDENHECGGSATMTTTAGAFFGDHCVTMVACNVEAGEDYDAAPFDAVFASLLVTFAVFLNA